MMSLSASAPTPENSAPVTEPADAGTDAAEMSASDLFVQATADIVLVLDRMGRVSDLRAAGMNGGVDPVARTVLARPPQAALGQYLPELVVVDRREVVARTLTSLRVGERLPPLSVRFDGADGPGPAVLLHGARLPGRSGEYHLALLQVGGSGGALTRLLAPRDPESGLLERDAFLARASVHMASSRAAGTVNRLSLIDLHGLAGLRRHLPPEPAVALSNDLGACLQALSVGGDTAGMLPGDRMMVIHAADISAGAIEKALRRVLAGLHQDAAATGIHLFTLDLVAPDVSDSDALRALADTLDAFGREGREAPLPHTLGEAFDALVNEGRRQVSVFGRYVLPNDFSMVFQPVVDMQTGAIKHVEALSRFADGSQTGHLVGYAEQVGMVEEFDLAVVGKVLWMLSDAPPGTPAVAINLSGRSLQSVGFTSALMIALDACGVPANKLLFEITETADIERLADVDRAIQNLRQRGYRVWLDDFGAGSSALPYLRALQVDGLKIDGGYIDQLSTSPRDQAIVRSIAALCASLGMMVVAERVETEAQRALLQTLGVDLGQGYLFGRPSAKLPVSARPAADVPPDAKA
jgi:EAL domain-containing protein (putative c-di-GMP-specific phosphodiesterase class I)